MQLRRQRRSGGEASLLLLLCFEALLGAVSFCPPRGYVARAAVPRAGFLPGCEATGADPVALARRSRRDVASRAQRSQPRAALRTYCPVPLAECPKVDSLFPPVPDRQLPPLIHHISAEKDWCSAVEMITTEVDMSNKLVFELLSFGAVYLSTPLVAGRRKQKAGLVEGMCKALRITEDMPVPRGSYVRVHANPKRHLVANAIDWSARILAQEDGLVVLDKPAGVPTVPTVDNLVESALFRVQQHIGQSLFSTSRLDTCTSGVVILARTPEACEAVNWAFRNRHVTKVYRVLCRGPVPLGTLRHCWRKRGTGAHANSKPSLLAPFDPALLEPPADHPERGADWQLAELEVQSCSPLAAAGDDDVWAGAEGLHECEVRLVTGRTHQVRLQFAACGAPLVGDSRYAPAAGRLARSDGGAAEPEPEFGEEPVRVGLQAARVALQLRGGRTRSFAAGNPWWRDAQELRALLARDAEEAARRGAAPAPAPAGVREAAAAVAL